MYLLWRRDTTTRGNKKITLPQIICLQLSALHQKKCTQELQKKHFDLRWEWWVYQISPPFHAGKLSQNREHQIMHKTRSGHREQTFTSASRHQFSTIYRYPCTINTPGSHTITSLGDTFLMLNAIHGHLKEKFSDKL